MGGHITTEKDVFELITKAKAKAAAAYARRDPKGLTVLEMAFYETFSTSKR